VYQFHSFSYNNYKNLEMGKKKRSSESSLCGKCNQDVPWGSSAILCETGKCKKVWHHGQCENLTQKQVTELTDIDFGYACFACRSGENEESSTIDFSWEKSFDRLQLALRKGKLIAAVMIERMYYFKLHEVPVLAPAALQLPYDFQTINSSYVVVDKNASGKDSHVIVCTAT
jgi:hypothetical protein